MVIAIMQTTSDRLRTVFRLMTDFRRQTPTSDFGPRPDFGFWTSDFEFHTSDLGLVDILQTSDSSLIIRHRTDVKLWIQRLRQFICHTTKTNIHM